MKYIKLFEAFDKDYVKNSIKDILIELQDMGMLVEVWNWKNGKFCISITGVLDKVIDYGAYGETEVFKKFNTNLIKDYVDTVIDFMKEFCPDFDVYFEYYDNGGKNLGESEILLNNKKIVNVSFTFRKRK